MICKDKRETQIEVAGAQGAEVRIWNCEKKV